MSKAPVCHISRDEPIVNQPQPVKLPVIPEAVDIPSIIAAINALKLAFQMLSGQQPTTVNKFSTTTNNTTTFNTSPSRVGRWNEVSRVTSKVRVFNPQDKEQYVDVERINGLELRDSVTGENWIWKR